MLIGFSEKAGSGVNKIFMGWKNANWRPPFVEEQSHPDREKTDIISLVAHPLTFLV